MILLTMACGEIVHVGSSRSGFKKDIHRAISPEEAYEKAKPFLEKTYQLRLKSRISRMDRPTYDTIIFRGSWYYISRDNYPYKTIRAYLYHAVRVHADTGKVVEPE